MKNSRLERLGRLQREYHRSHPWRLSEGGLYIPHSYSQMSPDMLSWWDDVGFILNGRRIIVWWQHPRHVYHEAIQEQAWSQAGDRPIDNWLTEGGSKNYRKVGRSRKKLVSYTCRQPSPELSQHHDLFRSIENRLTTDGIDFDVPISWKWKRFSWAMGVTLVVPLEVHNETELAMVANLARRLIHGKTTLDAEFPGHHYGRSEWLRDLHFSKSHSHRDLGLLADSAKLSADRASSAVGEALLFVQESNMRIKSMEESVNNENFK